MGGGVVREQDQYMPIANLIRIMRRVLPPHAKISDEAKETVQECVSEYISFVTAEANDRCQREQRKTVTAEDVLWAMGKLGFDDYLHPLSLFLQRYRDCEGEPSSSRRTPPLAMPMPMPMPPPPQQQQIQVPSYGYGFGPHVFDFDDTAGLYYNANAVAADSSVSANFVVPSSFDYSFPHHVKRDDRM